MGQTRCSTKGQLSECVDTEEFDLQSPEIDKEPSEETLTQSYLQMLSEDKFSIIASRSVSG